MRSVALLPLLCILLGGCESFRPPCEPAEQRCEDGVIWTCIDDCSDDECGPRWQGLKCATGLVCAERGDRAVCAMSSERDPSCDPQMSFTSYCRDRAITSCSHGYPIGHVDCAESGRICTDELTDCVVSATPDPRCQSFDACDGDLRVRCLGVYAERIDVCEAGCTELLGFGAQCILPDSEGLCPPAGDPSEYVSGCAGDSWYNCQDGVAYELLRCSDLSQVCIDDPVDGAGCVDPVEP